jgi:uncharacterized damage-inducible protein DinB
MRWNGSRALSIHDVEPVLRDSFDHEGWATAALLRYCDDLSPEQLRATAPGAYGSLAATIGHMIDSAAWYQHRLGLERLAWEAGKHRTDDPRELRRRADEVRARWDSVLEKPVDPEAIVDDVDEDGTVEHIRAGVYLAQALNHGSDHRDQACTIITTLGLQPPELDVWAYAYATGRVWTEPEPTV